MLRARTHLAMCEAVVVVFERDKQWRRDGFQRLLYGRRPHSHDVLDGRRRVTFVEQPEQMSRSGVGICISAEYDPVADGRIDDSRPFDLLESPLVLREHARHGRHEETDVERVRLGATSSHDVVAAPSEADDVTPGGLELFRLNAPHDPEG